MRVLILLALALLSGCASGHNYGGALLLAFGCIDAAMWWTAVAGAGAIFTVKGMGADHQQAKELRK